MTGASALQGPVVGQFVELILRIWTLKIVLQQSSSESVHRSGAAVEAQISRELKSAQGTMARRQWSIWYGIRCDTLQKC